VSILSERKSSHTTRLGKELLSSAGAYANSSPLLNCPNRADRRSCRPFSPSKIPTSALTHVNFAFAYIDPDTFEVTTMDSKTPEDLFQEVTAIKSMKSGLGDPVEVWVAIGGWTFSNNDTDTQPLLGKIAKSSENRQKFAENLIAFMTLYGFDGVDLDWYGTLAPSQTNHTLNNCFVGSTPVPQTEGVKRRTRRTTSSSSVL
jgi:hypothetical protein